MSQTYAKLEAIMREWLASDDAALRDFARSRLARPMSPPDPAAVARGPVTDPRAAGRLTIRTYCASYTGYGQIAEWLGRCLEAVGVPVSYMLIRKDEHYHAAQPFVTAREVDAPGPGGFVLQLAVPYTPPVPGFPWVAFTMWESSSVSREAVSYLNASRGVVVPCEWNAAGLRADGVTVPVTVCPLGVARAEGYAPRPWRGDGPTVFGMAARMSHGGIRKGLNEGMRVFADAFPRGDERVVLRVKVFEDCLPALRVPDDPRIVVDTRAVLPPQMAEWYESIDVLFVPSKGEGWGLHTLQAMACGRPVIAARYGGTAEFFDGACGWELPYREEPAGEFYAGLGTWAVPTHEGMVVALRAAHADPGAVRARGGVAATRAGLFPWDRSGSVLRASLDVLGALPAGTRPEPPPVKPKRPKRPGPVRRAANLARAVAGHVATGCRTLDNDAVAARLAVCMTCDERLGDGVCADARCGCNLARKARWADQRCPQGKWPGEGPGDGPVSSLPVRMVVPSERRPGIWRGGVIQIMVTRACDLACHHCTQGSNLAGKPVVMTPDEFDRACSSLQGYWGVVGMFGGNPATHPQFDTLCEIMRGHFPYTQRGLWCNNLRGKGAVARVTFNPAHSNINVHLDSVAAAEFRRDWPESARYVRGEATDSVHGAPFVALRDVVPDEAERWGYIGNCDINKYWSAAVGVVPGRGLRAFFCEIAYAQAALHAGNPDWCGTGAPMPDTGLDPVPGWWRKPLADFEGQVRTHCHACGIPLRREGQAAVGGEYEEYSETHRHIARPKVRDRPMELVQIAWVDPARAKPATEYLPGVTPGYRGG